MNPAFEHFLYQSEKQYLQTDEVKAHAEVLDQMSRGIAVYKLLRDQETILFTHLVDEIQYQQPAIRNEMLSAAVQQWSLVLKFCAMAMILNSPDYLASRIDNWSREMFKIRNCPEVDSLCYIALIKILTEYLADEEFSLIESYLTQAVSLLNVRVMRLVVEQEINASREAALA